MQVHNSVRYLEITCRICRTISDGTLGYDVGCWLFQLVFTQTLAGWFLLDAGMTAATEGTPTFVARSPDGYYCHLERMDDEDVPSYGEEARGPGEGQTLDESRGTALQGGMWVLIIIGVLCTWGRMWHAWHGRHDVARV